MVAIVVLLKEFGSETSHVKCVCTVTYSNSDCGNKDNTDHWIKEAERQLQWQLRMKTKGPAFWFTAIMFTDGIHLEEKYV